MHEGRHGSKCGGGAPPPTEALANRADVGEHAPLAHLGEDGVVPGRADRREDVEAPQPHLGRGRGQGWVRVGLSWGEGWGSVWVRVSEAGIWVRVSEPAFG